MYYSVSPSENVLVSNYPLHRHTMPPEPVKGSSSPDDPPKSRSISSRVNVSLLLELRKRKFSTWDEMLETPVDWIEPYANGNAKNGVANGSNGTEESSKNGDHESEDELFKKEEEIEECRPGGAPVLTKLRRGVLEIGPTMSRLRSNTFSSCCLDRLVVMHCSCGEVVKREAYGTHHRMKHPTRSSAPGSPTTSNGSVPPSPLTLQPPPISKLASLPPKMTPPRMIQKRSSPKVVSPPKILSSNNNIEEKKPRLTPPSTVGTQDWKVLSSSDGGGTKLRIVRINPHQSTVTPPSAKESVERIQENNPMMQPLPAVSTVTPSPTGSEEIIISPRDKRAAHREEIRQTRPTIRAKHRLSTPPVHVVAREEETRTSIPSSINRIPHPHTLYQSQPSTSYPPQSLHRPSTDHPSSISSLHPPSQSPLLISTSSSSSMGPRYTVHSPSSSQMVHPPPQQRPSPTLAYTNEHGQKVYLMPRGTAQMKRQMPMQHPQQQPMQQMQQGEGMVYGGGQSNGQQGQRQTIVIVLPPGTARNRNGPLVLPPGTTLRAIPSGQPTSHLHGTQTIQSGIGPNGQPVHYISHTPLPPSTRRIDMQGGTTMYPHHRIVTTQPHPSTSSIHHQPPPSYQIQQQHHTISSSTVPSYQYQMVHPSDGCHHSNHSDQMGQRMVIGQPVYGVQRVINPGMQRVMEQRRLLHTPSPPPTLQPMPVLRAQLFDEGTSQMRAKKSVSPSMVSSSTVDSPSQLPSSSTGFKDDRGTGKSALMEMLSHDDSSRDDISHEEVVSTGDGDEDEDETMPILECHSTFNEESETTREEEEEMPDALEGCDSSTTFSAIPSSSTM